MATHADRESGDVSSARDAASLVDALMADIAAALHDRPMQGLVASRLMLESAAGDQGGDAQFYSRGLTALAAAGEQTRDILWALDRSSPDLGRLQEDIRESFARVSDTERGLQVAVDLGGGDGLSEPAKARVDMVIAAVHDVVVDVVIRGGSVSIVDLLVEAHRITAMVVTSPGRPGGAGPWIRLARARLQTVGGSIAITTDDDVQRTVTMTVPQGA